MSLDLGEGEHLMNISVFNDEYALGFEASHGGDT